MQNRLQKRLLHQRISGFTLIELMLTASLIGLVLSIGVYTVGREWRRERVNTVAIEYADWLEAIRAASIRQPGSTPCVITFTATTGALAENAELARVAPASCAPTSPDSANNASARAFLIRSLRSSSDTYTVALNPPSLTTLTFSPRGTVSATADTDMRIQLTGTTDMRCVRLTATIGLIRIGSGSTTASDCTSYTVY